MTNFLKGTGLVIAGVVVGLLASVVMHGFTLGGVYSQTTKSFPDSAVLGDRSVIFKAGTIGPGTNQGVWTNNTSRVVMVAASDIVMGWTAGTASSSLSFYVSTSTATSVTDYIRPTSAYLLIDGANTATSTLPVLSLVNGTTTTSGRGTILVNPGENLIFNVQERYACKAVGACETATSTNRGIPVFFWQFKGTYIPTI